VKLVGLLDSPYVRRVAISLQLLELPFEHVPLSVFRNFDEFSAINPVVKAPSLVCDDGTVLLDSTLILEYLESLSRPRSLMPTQQAELRRTLRLVGLSLAACEKAVQIVYERQLRPPEKAHEPWLERVSGQLRAAFAGIETELAAAPLEASASGITQAGVTLAVTWTFVQSMIGDVIAPSDAPLLAAYAAAVETLPVFVATPLDGKAGFRNP